MGIIIDMRKLCARVGGRRDLATEFQVGKRKRGEASNSGDATSVQKEPSDHGPFDFGVGRRMSSPLEIHEATNTTDLVAAVPSGGATVGVTSEVINLESSSKGAPASPQPTDQNLPKAIQSDVVIRASFSSSGPVTLDHLSVTSPGVQSNWHVNRQAKDLSQVYPYDADLMAKVALRREASWWLGA